MKFILILSAAVAALVSSPALAESIPNLSLHNATLPADVDASGRVTIADLNLVFDAVRENQAAPLVAPINSETAYFLDTSANGRVNSQDALVIINYLLTTPVPEPTTVITAGLALAGFAGLCWRRRKSAGQGR